MTNHALNEWEVLGVGYQALSGKEYHKSDCATCSAPAYKPAPCDCDAPAKKAYVEPVMKTYEIEMRVGMPLRYIDAHYWANNAPWLVFYTKAPEGSEEQPKEVFRVQAHDVICMRAKS